MVAVTVTNRRDIQKTFEAKPGSTLMEALRDNGSEIEAICGGCCSCATCHVFVDPEWAAKLPPRSDDEQELVQATLTYRPETSRLSCQIKLSEALNGISLSLAPEE
jgi:2Fe-2S ferredoxin